MKKQFRIVSLLLTVILLMSVYVTPAAASQGENRGQERGQERQDTNQIQYLDAEVKVIDGQPVLKVETEEGYTSYEFPWPETAFAWTIPVAVAFAALKKAGVAVTTAATILIAAGRHVTASAVRAVINSWPTIRAALIKLGREATWWAVRYSSFKWVLGYCIIPTCNRRTPGGSFGDLTCTVH